MKKTLKAILVAVIMLVVLLALTGCGNKLVATKESEQNGVKVDEKIEVSFKKDKVNSVKMTYTFETKEQAEAMKGLFNLGLSMTEDVKMDVDQKGKKLIIKVDAKGYAEMAGTDEVDMSKDELKETLEEEGYKVK